MEPTDETLEEDPPDPPSKRSFADRLHSILALFSFVWLALPVPVEVVFFFLWIFGGPRWFGGHLYLIVMAAPITIAAWLISLVVYYRNKGKRDSDWWIARASLVLSAVYVVIVFPPILLWALR